MSDYWSDTIKSFEGLISYPKMEDKYLKRPPFRYIFQIFYECSKIADLTGNGIVSSSDLDKDQYESSEKKLEFVKKICKVVYQKDPSKQAVKPQSIIKGTESDQVNVFLRDLALFTKKNLTD